MRNQFGGHATKTERAARRRQVLGLRTSCTSPTCRSTTSAPTPRPRSPLGPGVTAFVGRNGQGKTNLVEAIDYVARLSSHRVAGDAPLVRFGADHAVVRAAVVRDGREAVLEVQINPGRSNKARVNRSPLPRARELLGLVRTVLFSPEDLALVKGDPSERRRFLDDLLVQRAPRFAGVRADYDRVLKQRNSLLKTAGIARRQGRSAESRAVHPRRLGLAPRPHRRRAARPPGWPWSRTCGPYVAEQLRGGRRGRHPHRRDDGPTSRPSSCRATGGSPTTATTWPRALLAEVERRRDDEVDRGISLVGPHRDDLTLTIGPLPVKGYASPRRVLVDGARAAAGVLRPAARRRRRPDPDPRRRLRRARHRAPRAAGRAGRRRRAGAGHRGGARRRAAVLAGARIDVVDGKVLPGVA